MPVLWKAGILFPFRGTIGKLAPSFTKRSMAPEDWMTRARSIECGSGPEESDVDSGGECLKLVDPPDNGVLYVEVKDGQGSRIRDHVLHADQPGPVELPGGSKVAVSTPNGSGTMTYVRERATS